MAGDGTHGNVRAYRPGTTNVNRSRASTRRLESVGANGKPSWQPLSSTTWGGHTGPVDEVSDEARDGGSTRSRVTSAPSDAMPARRDDLCWTSFDDEVAVVVLDPSRAEVHELRMVEAVVWLSCDGLTPRQTVAADIAEAFALDGPAATTVVQTTLSALGRLQLTELPHEVRRVPRHPAAWPSGGAQPSTLSWHRRLHVRRGDWVVGIEVDSAAMAARINNALSTVSPENVEVGPNLGVRRGSRGYEVHADGVPVQQLPTAEAAVAAVEAFTRSLDPVPADAVAVPFRVFQTRSSAVLVHLDRPHLVNDHVLTGAGISELLAARAIVRSGDTGWTVDGGSPDVAVTIVGLLTAPASQSFQRPGILGIGAGNAACWRDLLVSLQEAGRYQEIANINALKSQLVEWLA